MPKQRLGLTDHLPVPQCLILVAKRNVFAVPVASRASPGFRVKNERKQAQCLRLLRQQVGHKSRQKQRFLREIATDDISSARFGPAFCKGGIDGVQYAVEAAGKLLALRDAK